MPDLTDMLARWAELEPSRGLPAQFDYRTLSPNWKNDAILLFRVIQAIEARGWWWEIRNTDRVVAGVHPISMGLGWVNEQASSPATALLAAYLGALDRTVTLA